MTHSPETFTTIINFVVCVGIFWACICRLNSPVSKHYLRVRARYTLLLAGALISGLQTVLLGERPTTAGVVLAGVILVGLILNVNRWSLFNGTERRDENQ